MTQPSPSSPYRLAPPALGWAVSLSLLVTASAIGLRCAINFAHTLPGGMDAAYYPMQSWWLLEHGRLAYNDLPLIFVIGAALAKVLMTVGGLDIDAATMLASRLVDSVLPPFAAIAIVGLGWTWLPRDRRTRGAALAFAAAACIATLSLPIARMVGDFQKNSLGLIWLIAAVWAARCAFSRGGVWRWFALACAVGLAALTHVAVIGATVLVIGVAMLVFFIRQREWTLARALRVGVVSIGVAALLWGGIYIASPRRALALAQAPVKIFTNDRRGGPGGGPNGGPRNAGPIDPRTGEARSFRTARTDGPQDPRESGPVLAAQTGEDIANAPPFDDVPLRLERRAQRRNAAEIASPNDRPDEGRDEGPNDGPGNGPRRAGFGGPDTQGRPGGHGGPAGRGGPGGPPNMGGGLRMESLITFFAYPVVLIALWRLWRDRASIQAGDFGVVVGLIAATLLLACPFLSGEYAHRLSLMAPVPVAMLCVFLFVRRAERGQWQWPALMAVAIALAPTAAGMGLLPSPGPDARRSIAGRAIVSDADAAEMSEIRALITDPTHTLVVAPHGLEWWAGYYLKTAVAEGRPPDDAFVRYDYVYYLEQVGGHAGPGDSQGPNRPDAWPPGTMGFGTDGAFRDIDLVHEGTQLRLYEYPVPGDDLPG